MSKYKGGIYVIRCDKPGALLGLPFIGRHNAYTGMTNSYYHRERQHFFGSTHYGSAAKPFSDLRPKFYRVLPLPDWITKTVLGRKFVLIVIETIVIGLTIPVYNTKQQAPWNLRRINSRKADAQRIARMKLGLGYKIMRTLARGALTLTLIVSIGYGLWEVAR